MTESRKTFPLFTSARERSLWLWALTAVIAIYASLGWARILVDTLRERNLLRVSFAVLVILILVILGRQWLKKRPGWSEIGVVFGVALAYWGTFLRMENPAERTHLIEYGVVAALIHMALLEREAGGRTIPYPAWLALVITSLLGLVDESIQFVLPNRVFDWIDVLFNVFAGFIVIAARLAIAPVQGPGWRLWFVWVISGAIGWGWSMDPSAFGEPLLMENIWAGFSVSFPRWMSIAAGGTLVGVIHSLALRRYLPDFLRWIPATIGGLLLDALVVYGVGLFDADLGLIAGVSLFGFFAGIFQWRFLRTQVDRAAWWVPVSSLAWLGAIPFGDYMGPPGWVLYGAVQGLLLVWLLRRGKAEGD